MILCNGFDPHQLVLTFFYVLPVTLLVTVVRQNHRDQDRRLSFFKCLILLTCLLYFTMPCYAAFTTFNFTFSPITLDHSSKLKLSKTSTIFMRLITCHLCFQLAGTMIMCQVYKINCFPNLSFSL